jgi:hypothetical protein
VCLYKFILIESQRSCLAQLLILRQNQRSCAKCYKSMRSDSCLILRSDYLKLTKELRVEKIASPDSEKLFSILILKIYHRESNRIIKSLHKRIRSRIKKNQELELCKLGQSQNVLEIVLSDTRYFQMIIHPFYIRIII